jgi:hypothetical protein
MICEKVVVPEEWWVSNIFSVCQEYQAVERMLGLALF